VVGDQVSQGAPPDPFERVQSQRARWLKIITPLDAAVTSTFLASAPGPLLLRAFLLELAPEN